MTYLLKQLQTSRNTLRRIDIAPLEVHYMAVIAGLQALVLAGCSGRRVLSASRQIHAVIRALIKANIHNHHAQQKIAMLLNPKWRTRVLRELGGSRKLGLWMRRVMRLDEHQTKRRVRPEVEPVWWRSPERIAQSEALKAHARLCARACVHHGTFRDPYKMDREGQFRLAPLPRTSAQPRQAVIYSELTISDYNYSAVPVYKPEFGTICVTAFEFIAAVQMDKETAGKEKVEADKTGTQPLGPCLGDGPHYLRDRSQLSKASPFVWDDIIGDDEDETVDYLLSLLPEFLGAARCKSLFKPP